MKEEGCKWGCLGFLILGVVVFLVLLPLVDGDIGGALLWTVFIVGFAAVVVTQIAYNEGKF